MADISKENIIKSIKAILKGADLDQLSAKKIRKMLEAEYSADFTQRKEEIDKLVMQLITDKDSDDDKKDEDSGNDEKDEDLKEDEKKPAGVSEQITNGSTKPAAKKRPASPAKKGKVKGDAQNNNVISNNESGDDNSDISDLDESEKVVVPKKKAKTQGPQKKTTSPKKLNDEELAKQLQESENKRHSRRCKAQPVVRKPRKPQKERPKGTSVYSRPCALLPPLNDVMGTDRLPRAMIVKRLWEIVKERDLLDPKNKQFMLCDTEMQGLFGKSRVRVFGAMKLLKPYIRDLPKD